MSQRRFCVGVFWVKQLLIWVVLGFSCQSVFAGSDYHIKQFHVDNGLCDNTVTSIERDAKGFLWIGTNNGLVRYDGVDFELFRHDPFDSSSINSNLITALCLKTNGGLFVGGKDGKVSLWKGINTAFTQLNDNYLVQSTVLSSISGIYSHSDDVLLYGCQNGISALVNEAAVGNLKTSSKRIYSKSLSFSSVICSNNLGNHIVFGSGDSIGVFNSIDKSFRMLSSSLNKIKGTILAVELLDQNRYLVATSKGLFVIVLSGSSYQVASELVEDGVVAITKGKRGDYWVATDTRIRRFHVVESRISLENDEVTSDLMQGITAIKEDPQGVLWVGTSRQGLLQVRFERSAFLSYFLDGVGEEINAITNGKDGRVLLATSQGELYRVEASSVKFEQLKIRQREAIQLLGVKVLLELPDGAILIGGLKGLYVFDQQSGVVTPCKFMGFNHATIIEVTSLALGRKGEVWVGTPEGVGLWNGKEVLSFTTAKPIVSSLFVDNYNNLWIGSSVGLFKKDAGVESIKKVTGVDSFGSRVLSLPIVSFVVDKDGSVVLGTKNGLYRYSSTTNRVEQNESDNSLFSKGFITNIQLDRLYNVWVTVHNAVYLLGKSGQVRYYGIDEGMKARNIPTGASIVTSDGGLFVGGGNCLAIASSVESKGVGVSRPKAILSKLTVTSDNFEDEYYYEIEDRLSLKREGFSITAQFVLSDYFSSQNNRFKYRFKGKEEDFTELRGTNKLTLSDLSSGDYLLEVLGSTDGATWSDDPLLLKFVITPPLYKSGFAIAFYILALLFIGQLIYNVGIRYLLQIRKALAEEKNSKKLFETQSVKLALSNKSLTDSIDYAKRIQVALLPTVEEIRRFLPKSFLYYRPKDIVSGDFYAVFESKGKVVVVAVDCTGHGVPGAFMSMIGYEMLKNIVMVQGVVNPGQILQMMNDGVVSLLRHESGQVIGHDLDVNDGMDMSVCVIDKGLKMLSFAGAINPLYLIRDNEILIYKGSRFAVGQAAVNGVNLFKSEEISLQPDDVCYLFSDGYVDQFGGAEGKKFKFRRFRHLLLRIHRLGPVQQSTNIETMMNDWMTSGKRHQQVDDMLILGFSPLGVDSENGVY